MSLKSPARVRVGDEEHSTSQSPGRDAGHQAWGRRQTRASVPMSLVQPVDKGVHMGHSKDQARSPRIEPRLLSG